MPWIGVFIGTEPGFSVPMKRVIPPDKGGVIGGHHVLNGYTGGGGDPVKIVSKSILKWLGLGCLRGFRRKGQFEALDKVPPFWYTY